MHIIHVIPITNVNFSGSNDLLSYFSIKPIESGSLVEITIRNKTYPALAIRSEETKSLKLAIKRNQYHLKKINKIIAPPGIITESLISTCKKIASFYQVSLGQTLKLFINKHILTHGGLLGQARLKKSDLIERSYNCIIGSLQERIQHYKTTIRQALANDRNICIFVPTINLAEFICNELSDLPRRPFLIHGGLHKKQAVDTARLYRESTATTCLVATPIALSTLKENEEIIVEDADSRHYQRTDTPIINYANALKIYCDTVHARCTAGKYFPSLADIKNEASIHYLSSRIKSQKQFSIAEAPPPTTSLINEQLKKMLYDGLRTLIFVARKGYFTFVICASCDTTLACPSCGAFLVQHISEDRILRCNKCFSEYATDRKCQKCNGWDLRGYGIGTERVYEAIKNIFPSRSIWIFDESALKTRKRREDVIKLFANSKDGIIVGTDLIFEEPALESEAAAVLSLDNIFSIPDLTASARILTILYKLKEKTSSKMPILIQTRFPKHPLLEHVVNQDIKGYLIEELEERKIENLPPFTLAITLTVVEKNAQTRQKKTAEILARLANFKEHTISYPALGDPRKYIVLITIDGVSWQKNQLELKRAIMHCKELASIAVDPKSIL